MPTEKELAIYQGVLRLMREGVDIHALKASDIAAAAGIGKGTLYNYFPSKEAIIISTIRYMMYGYLESVQKQMESYSGFENKVRCALEFEIRHHENHHQTFFLLSYFSREGQSQTLREKMDFLPQLQQEITHLILKTADVGIGEGIIAPYTEEEILMAFTGIFASLSLRMCTAPITDEKEVSQRYYQMLVRSLSAVSSGT